MELQDVHSFNLYSDGTSAKQSKLSFSGVPCLHDDSMHGSGKMPVSIWQATRTQCFILQICCTCDLRIKNMTHSNLKVQFERHVCNIEVIAFQFWTIGGRAGQGQKIILGIFCPAGPPQSVRHTSCRWSSLIFMHILMFPV